MSFSLVYLHILCFVTTLPLSLCAQSVESLPKVISHHNHSDDFVIPPELANAVYNESRMLVTGGYRPSKTNLNKHVVSIRTARATAYFGDNHFCVGSIISDNLILTAAHCVVDRRKVVTRPHRLLVVAGSPNRFTRRFPTVEMKVSDVLPHPKFVRKGVHDIALLRLADHFRDDNDYVKIIPLVRSIAEPGTLCQIIGWGQLFYRGPYSAYVVAADVRVFSFEDCRKFYPGYFHESMVCAGREGTWDADACRGDSGGPLICSDSVAAIVSWGSFCGEKGKPTVFTSVYHHRAWIGAASGGKSFEAVNSFHILIFCLIIIKWPIRE